MMNQTVVCLEHIGKKLRGNQILTDIELTLTSGKIYGIEGANGSGKTMLMRIIAGLIYPTEGKLQINDKRIKPGTLYPVNLGMLIENPAFLAIYTGYQNLKLLAAINERVTEQEICICLKDVGLEPEDKRKYKKYSLGMKQRLGIAAAILEKPDILILDEPINALDESGVALVRDLIFREKERGALVLLSCHDREFLESVSDELYAIKEGVICGPIERRG